MRTWRVNSDNALRNARLAAILFLVVPPTHACWAQDATPKAAVQPADKSQVAKPPEFPALIELLETKVRFEVDGSSRKEVHAHVKINNELGVRQFARLNFDYNRSFEQVEIPLVRITHAGGGIADILPSAITDNPNPAVVDAPAYQDVRVKSVRILGLAPGDSLEYRVVTSVSHHPLAPDFWLNHSFDRSGVVAQEIFELDVPAPRHIRLVVSPRTPATSTQTSGQGDTGRTTFEWRHKSVELQIPDADASASPDIAFSTLTGWKELSERFANLLYPGSPASSKIEQKYAELTALVDGDENKLRALYDFVSQKIAIVDLPLGATGYRTRSADDILTSGYATQEDKAALFSSLARAAHFDPIINFGFSDSAGATIDSLPSRFQHILLSVTLAAHIFWLDPGVEVAPFGVIPVQFRGKSVFSVYGGLTGHGTTVVGYLPLTLNELPFSSFQRVTVDATLAGNGGLSARVKYILRGDNELLLRVAFHQAPKDKWKEVAQLLALSDGFRGQITYITASDPYATHDPFTLEYEITTPKFVDWSKKPVRIPALLPQLGLPDPPAKPAAGQSTANINLGTPLDVQTTLTLHLPPGTTGHIPAGISVERDYATFASQYNVKSSAITATRRLNFILREVPAGRAADYNAFLRAVQNDEAQEFTLESAQASAPTAPKTKSAEPNTPAPPKPAIAKP